MLWGHKFLKEEFDVTPRAAWLIDSFGHSAANARLYSEMGFEALFVGKIDYMER
jgi:alpha-mannosidase